MRSRRVAALVIALALTACGSTVSDAQRAASNRAGATDPLTGDTIADNEVAAGTGPPAQPASTDGGAPGTVTTRRGVTTATTARPTTGPVTIGFLNTKVGNAAAFGLNTGETLPPREVFEALVTAFNARGGIAGRQITPIIADTDTASARWETAYQAACSKFTQDNHVDAVVGYSFALRDSFESCLSKERVPHLSAGYAVGDVETFRSYPYFVSVTNPTADRRFVVQLEGARRAGLLTPDTKLGLLLDECAEHTRAHARSTMPYIQRNRLTVAATASMSCASGAADVGGIAAQIQSAVLRFRSRGVDTVVAEGIPVIVFATQAESQGWRPRYLLTTTTGGAALGANLPPAQSANMHGFGWFPPIDVAPGRGPAPNAPQQRCLEMLASQGKRPTQYSDFVNVYTACDSMFLYEAALKRTSGRSDGPSIVNAIASLGTSYLSATTLNGRTRFSATNRDAPAEYRQFGFDSDCSCYVYRAEAQPLP